MSAQAAVTPRTLAVRGAPPHTTIAVAAPRLVPALLSFATLAGFAAFSYADLLVQAPAGRIAAVVAIAMAGGAGLSRTRGLGGGAIATLVRLLVVLATAYVAFRAIGVPARLLSPAHWGRLRAGIDQGFAGLGRELWPYRGPDTWARLTLLLALPAVLVPAAALTFWPVARGAAALRALALAALLALYVTAAVNLPKTNWMLQGVVLLALIAAWIAVPRVPRADAGRVTAAVALCGALAVAVAPALRGGGAWIDYHAWNPFAGAGATFDWNQLYGPLTWSRSREVMFEVAAPRPSLWKVTTLDRFDGVRLLRSTAPPGSGFYDQQTPLNPRWYEPATFTIRGLRTDLAVGAGRLVSVSPLRTDVPATAALQADGVASLSGSTLQSGASYSVLAYVPRPTTAQLRAAPRQYPNEYLPYASFDLPALGASGLNTADLAFAAAGPFFDARTVAPSLAGPIPALGADDRRRVLASPYAPMYRLARRLAAGQPTAYDVVARVDRYLRANFTYSETPPLSRYPLESFLFADHIGYCQQFSGAMTLMLRMDGIPARVAAGFLPGTYDPSTHRYVVRAIDAHAWVEVYFDQIGWVPFDPTPPRPGASRLTGTLADVVGLPGADVTARAPRIVHGPEGGLHLPRAPARATSSADALPPLAALGGVLAALLVALAALWRRGAERLRRGLSGDAGGAAEELRGALLRLGYEIPANTTLAQLERWLQRSRGAGAGGYARMLRERRFAAQPAGGDGAAAVAPTARDRRALRRALSRGGGPAAWVRGLIVLPPGAARRWR